MRYNTPDNVSINGQMLLYRDGDAIPFFLMNNGKLIMCKARTRHVDYIENKFPNPSKRRLFVNSVVLQGRFWKDNNVVAFWKATDDDEQNIKRVLNALPLSNNPCYVVYTDRIYEYCQDENGYKWLKPINNQERNHRDISEVRGKIEYFLDGDMGYIQRNYSMVVKKGDDIYSRPLNDLELLAAGCYYMWSDFFILSDVNTSIPFTLDDVQQYISEQFKNRISFKELFNYFHHVMRKKMIANQNIDKYIGRYKETQNPFETLMDKFGFDDAEYEIIYFDGEDKPYSCNVKTIDLGQMKNLLDFVKASQQFIADRVTSRPFKDNNKIYFARIREKYKGR